MKIDRPQYVTQEKIQHFIKEALSEDVGTGDYSTLGSVSDTINRQAEARVKDDCVLAGVELACEIFHYYDKSLKVEVLKNDGEHVKAGEIAFVVSGSAQSILTVERLVLNCLQRMSGIATHTHQAVLSLDGTKTKILDTRKTSPNFRMCEKWAVHIGGGTNHRFGLFDMVMLKDNHVDYAGGIANAVNNTRKYLLDNSLDLKIEVETRNLREVQDAIDANVDIIMLDNMSTDTMKEAVDLIAGRILTEASGGIVNEDLHNIASCGVDYISSGAVIYAASIIDISLKAVSN